MYKQRLLLIDNYDSFTYNLSHLFMQLPEADVTVRRNDDSFLDELEAGSYDAVVIGRGLAGIADPKAFISTIRDKRFTPMAATEQLLRPS